jgi:hypothetical protein
MLELRLPGICLLNVEAKWDGGRFFFLSASDTQSLLPNQASRQAANGRLATRDTMRKNEQEERKGELPSHAPVSEGEERVESERLSPT